MEETQFSNRLQDLQQRAGTKARDLGRSTGQYVHENTWRTLMLAAVVGCVVGYLLSARD